MILLLAVAIPGLLGAIVIGAALAQRAYERSLGADIVTLRRRRAQAAFRLPQPANDAVPVMTARVRRRGAGLRVR